MRTPRRPSRVAVDDPAIEPPMIMTSRCMLQLLHYESGTATGGDEEDWRGGYSEAHQRPLSRP